MNNHFFDQQNLTKEAFVAKKEEQINKPKTKEMICPEESCDDFFEILQGKLKEIKKEVEAWQKARNNKNAKINWQFTNDQARIKLKRLYPSISN